MSIDEAIVQRLEAAMNGQFDRVHTRLDKIDETQSKLRERVASLSVVGDGLSEDHKKLREDVGTFKEQVNEVSTAQKQTEGKVAIAGGLLALVASSAVSFFFNLFSNGGGTNG